jgi:pilus assembly protein CpaD
MTRIKSLALLASLGLAAAGCASTQNHAGGATEPNRGLDSLHQPVVERTDFVLDLPTSGDRLASAEQARLDAWFQSLNLGYGDRVWVDEGYARGARHDVERIAGRHGLLLSDGHPVLPGEVTPGSVRVIVSRSSASVPGCPDWDGPGGPSATSPNYGCAVNSNIAAMVADPGDLVLGEAGRSTGDANTSGKAIRVYRERAPTGARGLGKSNTGDNK